LAEHWLEEIPGNVSAVLRFPRKEVVQEESSPELTVELRGRKLKHPEKDIATMTLGEMH
jgi:hypothetical protein